MDAENNQQDGMQEEKTVMVNPQAGDIVAAPVNPQGGAEEAASSAAVGQDTVRAQVEPKGQDVSRAQVEPTGQAEPAPAKKPWWASVNKIMLLTAILVSAGVIVALWALGVILQAQGFEEFVKRNFWWMVFPIFAGVLALLIFIDKGKEHSKKSETGLQPAGEFMQPIKESDEEYRKRMQMPVQYGTESESRPSAAQTTAPVQPQPADISFQEKSEPAAAQPVTEPATAQEPPLPLKPVEFKPQSANTLPIARDGGGAFFPQSATAIQQAPSSSDDE